MDKFHVRFIKKFITSQWLYFFKVAWKSIFLKDILIWFCVACVIWFFLKENEKKKSFLSPVPQKIILWKHSKVWRKKTICFWCDSEYQAQTKKCWDSFYLKEKLIIYFLSPPYKYINKPRRLISFCSIYYLSPFFKLFCRHIKWHAEK